MSATAADTRGFLDEERGFEVFDEECEDFFLLFLSASVAAMSSA
jgi:hypothetical protein